MKKTMRKCPGCGAKKDKISVDKCGCFKFMCGSQRNCPSAQNDFYQDEFHASRRCLETQIKQLQAVVDKLPKTADGAPVTLGMKVYVYNADMIHVGKVDVFNGIGDNGRKYYWRGSFIPFQLPIEECYSTRKAARAA